MGGAPLHVRTYTPRVCISGTARPIVFKFGVWVGVIHYVLSKSYEWDMSWSRISPRAHVHTASVSQERLGRLCSNFKFGVWVGFIYYVLSTSHGGISQYVHTCTPRFCISGLY